MADLSTLMGTIPTGGVARQSGTMVLEDGQLAVNVWGNVIPARYADPLYLVEGDPVLVDITSRGYGQSEAVVVCKLTARPRPATGVIQAVPVGSLVDVLADDGLTYQAEFIGSYAVGNYVYLNWAAGTPTVVGKKGETKPPVVVVPPSQSAPVVRPPEPPAPRKTTGTTSAPAIWSGTHSTALRTTWDGWAGGRENLFQGTYGGNTMTGAWFYGSQLRALDDGRKITRVRFRVPSRRSVGNYNSTAYVHLYTHTSSRRPGGNVTLDDGPMNYARGPGQRANFEELPLSVVPRLLAGGGIAMRGDPYVSLLGRVGDRESGLLLIDWEK